MSTVAFYEDRGNTQIIEGTVTDVNMRQWTVDVYSKRTARNFPDVQVASPYVHHNEGEGMYAVPDVGSTCMICVPSDDSPPFVLGFVAAPKIEGEKKPKQVLQNEEKDQVVPMGYTYSVDRPVGEPGDIFLRGRNGNHIILHTGGVLEVSASPTASRIYMPLGHIIDFSQEYDLRTPGGTIHWGVQDITNAEDSSWVQTLRVHANDKYADIRITKGYVDSAEMPGDDKDHNQFPADPIYEIAVIKNGFMDDGTQVAKEMTLLFHFDREGNVSAKAWGNIYIKAEGSISMEANGGVSIKTDSKFSVRSSSAFIGANDVTIASSSVKIAGAAMGVARLGDQVTVVLPPKLAAIANTPFIYGAINTASSMVLVS